MLLIWVDDFAVGCNSREGYNTFVDEYKKLEGLDIRDEGPLSRFVGIDIIWNSDSVEISQEKGIERAILKHFPSAVGLKQLSIPATYDSKLRTRSRRFAN